MRLLLCLAMVLFAGPVWAGGLSVSIGYQSGDGGVSVSASTGPGHGHHGPVGYRGVPRGDGPPPGYPPRIYRPYFGSPIIGYAERPYQSEWERRIARKRAAPPPAPVPEPVPAPVVALDARGPRFLPARGIRAERPSYQIGTRLPRRQTFVALDWRRYDLTEPEPGQLYIRVGADVLLIDTATNRVVDRPDLG